MRRHLERVLGLLLVGLSASACGPGRDVHDAFNSRETGPYLSRGRAMLDDGTLVVHVMAHQHQHAEAIARQIVRQNFATAPRAMRVIVDPTARGERRVFRWDGRTLSVDSSPEGLPPPPQDHGDAGGH